MRKESRILSLFFLNREEFSRCSVGYGLWWDVRYPSWLLIIKITGVALFGTRRP